MHVSFTAHNPKVNSQSSSDVFNYLSKENEKLEDKSLLLNNENFFSNDFDIKNNNGSNYKMEDCIISIDNNLSSRHKSKESSFYILNIAPSQKELKHIDDLALVVLKERGLELSDSSDDVFKQYFFEQKNIVTDTLLKDYASDIMNIYSENMNRDIYVDVNNLPSESETRKFNEEATKQFDEYLKSFKLDDESLGFVEKVDFVEISNFNELKTNNYEIDYNNEKHNLFLSSSKFEVKDNKLMIDKKYLEQSILSNNLKKEIDLELNKFKVEFKTDWENSKTKFTSLNKVNYDLANKDFKNFLTENHQKNFYTKVDATILKSNEDKIFIQIKDNNQNDLQLWVNKSNIFEPQKDYKIDSVSNLKIESNKLTELKDLGTKRNLKDLELKPLDFGKQLKVDEKEKHLVKVEMKIGKEDKIVLSFNKDVLVKEKGKYFVPNHILEKAKQNSIKSYVNVKFSEVKENFKNEIWKENGFNPEKRKLTKDDLMYFAKIENQRTYKVTNKLDYKLINENNKIQKQIDEVKKAKGVRTTTIARLESKLHRDKHTGEIIKEGVVKGGNNKHLHIVVSKYDAILPKHHKMSLSPNSTQKNSKMPTGKQVGFNRDNFFKKVEKGFDQKFEFKREINNTYQYKNETAKLSRLGNTITKPLMNEVVKEIKKEINNPITQLKQEINPIGKLKQELKFVPFPTSIPKSKLDLLIKVGKFIVQSVDKGLKM